MKHTQILKRTYWLTTILFSVLMAFSAISYLTQQQMRDAFAHLGYPTYFRIELAFAKAIGVIVLLSPVPGWMKHWAYAGFGFTLASAVIAHLHNGDPIETVAAPVIIGLLFVASYVAYLRLHPSR